MTPMHEWLYLPGGKVAHAFEVEDQTKWIAECGTSSDYYWYGTGTQDEYNRAAALPRCQKCLPRVSASEKGRRKPRGIR